MVQMASPFAVTIVTVFIHLPRWLPLYNSIINGSLETRKEHEQQKEQQYLYNVYDV